MASDRLTSKSHGARNATKNLRKIQSACTVGSTASAVRKSIGVIPQAMTSDLDRSAEENMQIFAKLYGVPRERRNRIVKELLEAVELTNWADKPVKNLSGGSGGGAETPGARDAGGD